MNKVTHFIIVVIIAVLLVTFLSSFYSPNFEEHKCPFCYGKEFCHKKDVALQMSSITDIINNLISVKNVQFTTDGLVLKKLGHTDDLNLMDKHICILHGKFENCELNSLDVKTRDYESLLKTSLKSFDKGYRICGGDGSVDLFLKRLLKDANAEDVINLWTISLINFEPLFYKVFNDFLHNHLPEYYGACGRVVAMENCGRTLNEYANHDWFARATIARSIIALVLKFTAGDPDFHIYLTDVSPDNVVVDGTTLNAKFVDFGNVILVKKLNVAIIHKSHYYSNDHGFVYVEEDICCSSISDHNIYSVCKLLFSSNAPWPMMSGGLLHSIPDEIKSEHPQLLKLIKSCVKPISTFDRFASITKLDHILKGILSRRESDYCNL